MAQGDGSISSAGRGKWRVSLSLGADPITGKYRRVTKRVTGTKADAKAVLAELRRQKEDGIQLDKSATTVSELCTLWLEAKETSGTCGKSKLGDYRRQLRHVCAHIGNVRVCDVDARIIESTYARIRKERKLAGSTMLNIHTVLKSCFEKAIDYDLITRNPCKRVAAPRREAVERRSLTRGEVATLTRALAKEHAAATEQMQEVQKRQTERGNYAVSNVDGLFNLSCIMAVRVVLATGLRRGEAFALTWDDVDLSRQAIAVRHSLTEHGEIKQPKSRAGLRTIAIDPETARQLAEWKEEQAGYLRRLGIIQGLQTPVSCSQLGGYADLHNVERFWREFRNGCGLEGVGLHMLRHTQATELLANGADLKMVQTRLGHSSAALTLGTYAHAVPENDGKAAEIMNRILNGEERKAV